jgi:hypothetical protein
MQVSIMSNERTPSWERVNPDDFLLTPAGRVWTPERNEIAWKKAYAKLTNVLEGGSRDLYLVCGLQGAGKSTWIEQNASSLAPCVFFDAALPRAIHRRPILTIADSAGAKARCVWVDTPFEIALLRNSKRPEDERVPEASIRSVAEQFEAPSTAEGFVELLHITTQPAS